MHIGSEHLTDAHPDGTDLHLHIAALGHGTDLITVTRVPLAPAYTHTSPKTCTGRFWARVEIVAFHFAAQDAFVKEGSRLLMEENSEIIKGSDRQKHFLCYIS